MDVSENIKLVYIAGSGRNGSTLLAYLLGEIPKVTNVGEAAQYLLNLRQLRTQNPDIPCGCGAHMERCAFWRQILPEVDPLVVDLASSFVRLRNLPLLLSRSGRRKGLIIVNQIERIYSRVAKVAGAEVIVDSSKNPALAYLLAHLAPHVELHILHLVRDPRAVVNSWSKAKQYVGRAPLLASVWNWNVSNFIAERIGRRRNYVLVRYEDLAAHPKEMVLKLLRWIGYTGDTSEVTEFLKQNVAVLGIQHSLAGNPDKLHFTGAIDIKVSSWEMERWMERIVVILTWPFFNRYGYQVQTKA